MKLRTYLGCILKVSDAAFTSYVMVKTQYARTLECVFLTSGKDDDYLEKNPRDKPWIVELTETWELPPRVEIAVKPIYSTECENRPPERSKRGRPRKTAEVDLDD